MIVSSLPNPTDSYVSVNFTIVAAVLSGLILVLSPTDSGSNFTKVYVKYVFHLVLTIFAHFISCPTKYFSKLSYPISLLYNR